MNLRDLANKHEAFDGQVMFYFLPYQSLKCDVAINTLERITPQFQWKHQNGTIVTDEPREWTAAKELARPLKRSIESEWERERLWNLVHDVFAVALPSIVDVEFALTDKATAEVRGLQMFFQSQNGSTEKNWTLYNDLIGAAALGELWRGYLLTRDTEFSATALPSEADTDPEVSGGAAT
jgi:hypothetical protein